MANILNNLMDFVAPTPEQELTTPNDFFEGMKKLEAAVPFALSVLAYENGPEISVEAQPQPVETPLPDNVVSLDEARAKKVQEVTPTILNAAAFDTERHEAQIAEIGDWAKREAV